jgi:hypothetical protein
MEQRMEAGKDLGQANELPWAAMRTAPLIEPAMNHHLLRNRRCGHQVS